MANVSPSLTADVTAPRPRSKRRRKLGLGLVAVCTALIVAGCISQDQLAVQTDINNDRAAYGRAALVDYTPADTKAQAWANQLAKDGYLHHSNLASGYQAGTWCKLGENVGMGPSISAVDNGFMHSAPHKANILDPAFDHHGTGVAKNQATGYVFVVQEFVDLC